MPVAVGRKVVRVQDILRKAAEDAYSAELWLAVKRGELVVRSPLTYLPLPVEFNDRFLSGVVFVEGLVKFVQPLKIGVTIEDPDVAYQSDSPPHTDKTAPTRGLTKQQLGVEKWPVRNFNLSAVLSDKVPNWLMSALVDGGARGKRDRKWNPVQLGVCLVSHGNATKPAITKLMQESFNDFLDAWLEVSEHL